MPGMNKITLNFTPCTPAPGRGYNIQYRILGSSDPMTNAGNFFITPAIFYDNINPFGTLYEGFIMADCGNITSDPVYWNTSPESGSGEGPAINVSIVNNGSGAVSITDINGIAGFAFIPPLTSGSQTGHHDAFTGSIGIGLSSSGSISGSIKLYKNGVLLECFNIGFPGSYGFSSFSFVESDIIQVIWFGGPC